jgi:predicted permease
MLFDAIATDVRFAVRRLARTPIFTLAVVAVMALGIGANAAVFTALDQTVVRPLPFREPERLVMLWEDFSALGRAPKQRVSPATFVDWRRLNRSFEAMGAFGLDVRTLSGDGTPREVHGARVTANLIPLLGVSPLLGRTFSVDEESQANGPVVLGFGLWRGQYGGDPAVVGRTILMNGQSRQVIGVMPRGFDFPDRETDYWLPLGLSPQLLARRNSHFLNAVGRLLADRHLAQAQADMTAIAAQLAREYPASNARIGITIVPLKDEMVGDTRTAFTILIAAAACVLLLACANVAHLLLARATARRADVAVRMALGASPRRVVSEILTESTLLAALGAVGGLVVARWSLAALQQMVPSALSGFVDLHVDPRVLAFTAAITMGSSVLFGLAPAWQLSHTAPLDTRGAIGGGHRRTRNLLIILEVAVSFVLVVGAGLLVRTLWHLRAVDPGFRSGGMLTATAAVPLPKYQDSEQRGRFYTDALARIRTIPGVTMAGATSDLPYRSPGDTMGLQVEGQPAPAGAMQDALFRLVSVEYLQTIGARLVQGRLLDAGDRADSTPVVVVNETLARQYWPAQSPLGHRIDTGTGDGTPRWMTIVGVVADVRERGLDRAMKPGVYVPYTQTAITFFQPSELAIRTTREPLTIAKEVQEAVWSVDRDQPISNLRTMDDIVEAELANRTQMLELLGTFAALAVVLAAFGVYAVLSLVVSQRTREIGLRLAVGARPADIVVSLLAHVGRLTATAVVAGTAAGIATTRLLSSLLYGVTPLDWRTFAAVALLLTLISLLAALVPTRRAATVDPIIALRGDS